MGILGMAHDMTHSPLGHHPRLSVGLALIVSDDEERPRNRRMAWMNAVVEVVVHAIDVISSKHYMLWQKNKNGSYDSSWLIIYKYTVSMRPEGIPWDVNYYIFIIA